MRNRIGALFVLAAACAGCSSSKRAGVEGKVNYDGEPIAVGSITFLPADEKGIKCGGRIEAGRYTIDPEFGPEPGPHRVEIRWSKPTGKKYKNEFGEEFDRMQEGLPDKYHKDSALTATIEPKNNVIDFDLAK